MSFIIIKILVIFTLLVPARAQPDLKFGQFDTRVPGKSFINSENLHLNKPTIILEKALDPVKYIIGSGDVFGININTMEKMFFSSTVGPAGDLLIPGVGPIIISGYSLEKAIKMINDKISTTYKNADVDVSLINLKSYKIQIYGAVNNPGFAEVIATTRLDAALNILGGLHRYANEENISVTTKDGFEKTISLKEYLHHGDLENNPQINEGDIIKVPFETSRIKELKKNITFKKVPVLVTGFVNLPGPINYFPGYSVKDYIGMAGGISDLGNVKKVYLIRNDEKSISSNNKIVIPGDHIIVPEGTFSVLFGKNSFLQNLTALFSIISTYTIISDRINN